MTAWALLLLMVSCTTIGDLLQSREMKQQGEIDDFRLSRLGRVFAALAKRKLLLLAMGCMAVSFFSFLALLRVADLSFAVPASAVSFVAETALARLWLKEHVDTRRWLGAVLVTGGVALLAQ